MEFIFKKDTITKISFTEVALIKLKQNFHIILFVTDLYFSLPNHVSIRRNKHIMKNFRREKRKTKPVRGEKRRKSLLKNQREKMNSEVSSAVSR